MKCPVCKKNISDTALKCPYCKTRTGLLCSNCNKVNRVGSRVCSHCGNELLKICPHCASVNFPTASKCRKCGSPFGAKTKDKQGEENVLNNDLKYTPKYYSQKKAIEILTEQIPSGQKKIFSISGQMGSGKTTVLKTVIKNLEDSGFYWMIGRCSQLTQLTPGGAIQNMLLNLFNLPTFCQKTNELQKEALSFFSNEFKFLSQSEVAIFFNFLYNFNDGKYEDIVNNKNRMFDILHKVFAALAATGKFIFVLENFDYIDGFSAEFFTEFVHQDNWEKLKLIAIYNEPRPIGGFFGYNVKDKKAYTDIALAPFTKEEMSIASKKHKDFISEREREIICSRSKGNIAFIEQGIGYAIDCQITDRAFLLPDNFSDLIKSRLTALRKINNDAYKVLCAIAIVGEKVNVRLIKEIFEYDSEDYKKILIYLKNSNYIKPVNNEYYEFNNILLWETILKNITRDSVFDDINIKVGKIINGFSLNTNSIFLAIAGNLRENRMAFDVWTRTTQLAACVGDINLYVIAQKQCLAIINEFNEDETLKIRYNISERLGKILSLYDPAEAIEFLPDAIAKAKETNDEVKEIELLSYLANCCSQVGNYFGNVECIDNVLLKLQPSQKIEKAMIQTAKLSALIDIGNCGEVINIIDNDILPVLNTYIAKPSLSKMLPTGLIFDSWLKVHLMLGRALALQGNKRAFEVIKNLFDIINKHRINDKLLNCQAGLTLALANTMKGDYSASLNLLSELLAKYEQEVMDDKTLSRWNLIYIINKFLLKDYDGIREKLFEAVTFANNIGDNFTKNILKSLLGVTFKNNNQTKHALDIYNEQVTYFAKEKMATGALLNWYLIAEATIVTENPKASIDVAQRALEIAQTPNINNYFFIIMLKMVLAKAYMAIADYETAKIHLESAISIAKKHEINDLLTKLYFQYANYNREIGTINSASRLEYLKGASALYKKAQELAHKTNLKMEQEINAAKYNFDEYCRQNGFNF